MKQTIITIVATLAVAASTQYALKNTHILNGLSFLWSSGDTQTTIGKGNKVTHTGDIVEGNQVKDNLGAMIMTGVQNKGGTQQQIQRERIEEISMKNSLLRHSLNEENYSVSDDHPKQISERTRRKLDLDNSEIDNSLNKKSVSTGASTAFGGNIDIKMENSSLSGLNQGSKIKEISASNSVGTEKGKKSKKARQSSNSKSEKRYNPLVHR